MERWMRDDDGPFRDFRRITVDRAALRIHPMLEPESQEDVFTWDMRFAPEGNARRYRGFSILPFSTFAHEPVASPKLDCIQVVSIDFPWIVVVQASDPIIGVTFGDLLERIYVEMDLQLLEGEWRGTTPHHVQHIIQACSVRESMVFPENWQYGTLKRIDWLVGQTAFCGMVDDMEYAPDFVDTVPGMMVMLRGLPEIEVARRRSGGRV